MTVQTGCGSAPSKAALPEVFGVAGLLSEPCPDGPSRTAAPGVGTVGASSGLSSRAASSPGSLNGLTLPEGGKA